MIVSCNSIKNGSIFYNCVYVYLLDGIAHPMILRTQYHKTASWNCKRSVVLSQTHVENILPYTLKIDSARAVTTFSRNYRFFAIRKSLKMPEWNFISIHSTWMSKIVYTNSECNDDIKYNTGALFDHF